MIRGLIQEDLKKVSALLLKVFGVNNYAKIERMGGLTNHTYKVILEDGRMYAVRIPGEGTEKLIVRREEKISTELAWKLDIDAELIYFGEDGSKITQYIPDAVTMSADDLKTHEHIRKIANVFGSCMIQK